MSWGVSVRGVSVRGVSDQGVCVLGVSVRGVHVRGGFVLSPTIIYQQYTCNTKIQNNMENRE